MTSRSYSTIGMCAALLALALATAAGQERRLYSGAETGLAGLLPPAEAGVLPRTPWGDPDLRGVWNNSTDTPLERLTAAEQERSAWRGRLSSRPHRARARPGSSAPGRSCGSRSWSIRPTGGYRSCCRPRSSA